MDSPSSSSPSSSGRDQLPKVSSRAEALHRCGDEVLAMLKCVDEKQWTWHWSCMEQHVALQRCYLECQEQPQYFKPEAWKPVWKSIERAQARFNMVWSWVVGGGQGKGGGG